jgi:predicted TIM-barrel fold metal-dependent hydrolase
MGTFRMIIDCHNHIAGPRHLPPEFFDGWASTIKATLPDMPIDDCCRLDDLFARLNYDPDCHQLLREMDDASIDLAVLLVIDFGFAFPSAEGSLQAAHDEVEQLCAQTGRFVGFAGVDPRRGQAGVDFLERALRDRGFRGLKLYPPCGYSPSDPRLYPFYEVCQAYGVPVLSHIGPTTSTLPFTHTHPQDVDVAAHRFPKVNFILAHAGVVWYREAAMLAQYRPNIYLDLSGFQAELADGKLEEILRSHLRLRLGHKLLFGTDWPIHRFFGNQKKWVEALRATEGKGIASGDLANMFEHNARRIIPGLDSLGRRGATAPALSVAE